MMTSKLSKLDNLIQELCPNGVEFMKLGDVISYEQPTKYIVKDTNYNDDYKVPVLTAGKTFILGYTNEENGVYDGNKKPTILFDDFVATFHWVDFPFKVKSGATKFLHSTDETIVKLKFAYHYMKTIWFPIDGHRRRWIKEFSQLSIPVPPIEIQEEIVRILDQFTELTAELTAELTGRQKQYEYYRNQLLTFDDEVEWKKLAEVADEKTVELGRGKVISKNEIRNNIGTYPVYSSSAIGDGSMSDNYNKYMFDEELITWSIDGGGKFFYRNKHKFSITNVAGYIRILDKNKLNMKFLYHSLINAWGALEFDYMNKAHPSIIRDKYLIPIPSIEIQEEIVRKLDYFDNLVNSISEGLPREIELREKQYEYYRNKLLSFEELKPNEEDEVNLVDKENLKEE